MAAGLTQEALAERCGLSAKAIGELERKPNRTPRLESVNLLSDALQLAPFDRARLLSAAHPPDEESISPELHVPQLHDLPRSLTPLIGRAGAIEAVASLVQRPENRFITLTGPGGVGKTRLAIEVAGRVVAAFTDGVVFVDLSPTRDPALVLPVIAQHLGVDERGELGLRDRLASALRSKHLLLVLDNLEHLVVVGADLRELLSHSDQLVILATSRVPLRVRGEREYRVAPLELPSEATGAGDLEQSTSVVLFLDRVRAAGVDLNLDDATSAAVAAICRRLDGLPLALELAAAWAPLLSPVALLDRLERRLPMLAGGPPDLPPRQRTMMDAIAWSYDLLDPSEQRLFRQMSVFAGGFSLESVAAVCGEGDDEDIVLTRVAALVQKNLLRRVESAVGTPSPRLSMLETIREYGLEQLTETGEANELRSRHAQYFLGVAEEAALALRGSNQLYWVNRLELDHENLRAALAWVCEQNDSRTSLRLTAALWRFWSVRGHGLEAQRWLERVLEVLVDGNEPPDCVNARVKAQTGAAVVALDRGALDDAEAKIAECLPLARQSADPVVLVDALNAAGLIARTKGDYVISATRLEEALEAALRIGYRSGEATARAERGLTTFLTGDASCAERLLEQAIAIYRELGDTGGLAACLRDLGWMTWHAGDAERGELLREEALTLFRALGDTGQIAETLWGLGISVQYRGDYERATELYEESLALRRSRGDDLGAAQVLSTLAQVSLHQRKLLPAREMFDEALDTARRLGDRWGQAMILALQGHLELASGRFEIARECFNRAARLYAEIGNLLYLPWCLEGLAGIAMAEHHAADAALLFGARDAMLDVVGQGLPPADPPGYTSTWAAVRAALDEAAFIVAHEAGRSLAQHEIVTLTTNSLKTPLVVQPSDWDHLPGVSGRVADSTPKN